MANALAEQLRAIAAQITVAAARLDLQTQSTLQAAEPAGTTASTWQEPPAPWPIDARYLSDAQIAALTPSGTLRANYWSQCWTTAARAGNADQAANVAMALLMYRAYFVRSEDLGKPFDAVWTAIFSAYGVPIPAPSEGSTDYMKGLK